MAPRKKVKLSKAENAPHDGSRPAPTRPTRSRKGCLENIQTLPLDISLQIFGHLHPKDLLNLAKTSKAFRSFFLSRATSISIWKASLSHLEDLPERPASLSEPAFAHLLFNPYCQNCGKSGIQNPIWPWFVRYCTDCTHILSEPFGSSRFDLFNIYEAAGRYGGRLIHKPQLEHFIREWKNCGDDEEKCNALKETQRMATKEQAMLAQRFEAWHTAKQTRRSAELEGMRQQRLQDVLERLTREDSEWLPEMEYFGEDQVNYRICDIPAVRQTSKLTDRGWPKVLDALEGQMERLRSQRLEHEREEQIKERLHELEKAILEHYVRLPKTVSMDCRPSARILLGEKQCFDMVVAPRDQDVTCRDFAQIVPNLCSRWEAACAKELRRMVRATIPAIPDDVDPLSLAVAVFECAGEPGSGRSCSGRVAHRYPSLLAHSCLCRHPRTESQKREKSGMDRIAARLSRWDNFEKYVPPSRMKIQPFRLAGFPESVTRMKYIVSALGLDPIRAKHEEISDAMLWCRVCSPSSREVYSWETAFFHRHSGCGVQPDFWQRLGQEDMATIRQLREERNLLVKYKAIVRWGCTLCEDWDSIGTEVESHLKEEHQREDLDECIKDGTVYLHHNQSFSSTHTTLLPLPDGGSGSGNTV